MGESHGDMFLLTFVLVIISALGVYTQVFALESAKLFNSQTSLAQTVLAWHEAAASVAGATVEPASAGASGCGLSPFFATPGANVPACDTGTAVSGGTGKALVTGGPYSFQGITAPNLATGYQSNPYQWKSVAFQTDTYYVLTYVDPPARSGDGISTANAPPFQLSYTMSDLFRQLQNLGIPSYSFGYIQASATGTGRTLTVPPIDIDGVPTPMPYQIPGWLPVNAVAIISSPGICNGC